MTQDPEVPVLPSPKAEAVVIAPEGSDAETPAVEQPAIEVSSLTLNVLTVVIIILVLQYAQSVLIPIVLGVLISYALAPVVSALHKARIPRGFGAAVAVMLLVGGLGLGIYTLSDQAMAIVSAVPPAAQRIRERLRTNRYDQDGAFSKVQQAATEIDRAAQEAAAPTAAEQEAAKRAKAQTDVQKVEVVQPAFRASDYLWSGGLGLLGFAGQFVLVLFLRVLLPRHGRSLQAESRQDRGSHADA